MSKTLLAWGSDTDMIGYYVTVLRMKGGWLSDEAVMYKIIILKLIILLSINNRRSNDDTRISLDDDNKLHAVVHFVH